MKALLIMNPGARSGSGRKRWPFWESALRRSGVAFEVVKTAQVGHARALAAAAKGVDTVVAVGGDGTINEVLDGLMARGGDDVAMGVLYSGTSPDFCRFHGIPVEPQSAIDALAEGARVSVDVVRIVYDDAQHVPQTAHFGCGANVGLGASVARLSNRLRRFTGDCPGTCFATLASIVSTRPVTLYVEIDGRGRTLERVRNLTVLKSPFIASGLRLNIDLRPDDGMLAVVAVHGKNPLSVLALLPAFYSGKAIEREDVFMVRGRSVRVTAARDVEVEFDGDPRGWLPVELNLRPKALKLIGGSSERV